MGDGLKFSPTAGAEFGRVVQYAFHAPEIESAARRWSSSMRAGPFILLDHIGLAASRYRGNAMKFDHSSAYGQCGSMMIELIHQHDDSPSAVRDMFDAKTEGLHHIAVFVDDLAQSIEQARREGMEIALDAMTNDGVGFVVVDARQRHGVMLEVSEPSPALLRFYGYVKRKSENWAGADFLRRL